MLALKRLGLLFFTLRHLKLQQLAFFILRRKFPSKAVTFNGPIERNRSMLIAPPLPIVGCGEGSEVFCFLNQTKHFNHSIDWAPQDVNRLWRYNLHYFDYLREGSRSDNDKTFLLEHWLANNPQGSEPGWEPFTASLRIVNWVFYFQQSEQAVSKALLHSLYEQVLWLEKNDERHILANHYVENLKALAFAGCFFAGRDAKRWRQRADRELQQQLTEQVLADGGHYERTPQYHGLMLENFLDLYNLVAHNRSHFSDELLQQLTDVCQRALAFFAAIQFPDQRIPLLNDSAFGISPSCNALASYWERLSKEASSSEALAHTPPPSVINYPSSGIYGYRSSDSMLVVDAGDIGPAYQPGHTHCDMLSYELMWGGERLIVDTGVYEYEPGPMRHYVRSTRAHNTVAVGGDEQSEIWGEFRVARRAKLLAASAEFVDDRFNFSGSYRGFYALPGKTVHQRALQLHVNSAGGFERLHVQDTVQCKGEQAVESFILLHPNTAITELANGLQLQTPGGQCFHLTAADGVNYYREQAFYCPEFGVKMATTRIVFAVTANQQAKLAYSLTIIS